MLYIVIETIIFYTFENESCPINIHCSTTVSPFGGEERKDETRIFDESSARARGEENFARPTIDAQPDND